MEHPLPGAFIALAVYYLLQVLKPPLKAVLVQLLPQDREWQDNGVRAAGYLLTYALALVNVAIFARVDWQAAWNLLGTAGAIYGGSALLYHIQEPAQQSAADPSPPPSAPPSPPPTPPAGPSGGRTQP